MPSALCCFPAASTIRWHGRRRSRRRCPNLDIRVSPELGDPAEIETALVWKAPPGELRLAPQPQAHHQSRRRGRPDPRRCDDPAAYPGRAARRRGDGADDGAIRHLRGVAPLSRDRPLRASAARAPLGLRAAARLLRLPGRGDGDRALGRRGGADAGLDRLSGRRLGPLAAHPRRHRDLPRRGRLAPFLARTEFLVVPAAADPETRHIVDRDALYRLPRGAKLVNWGAAARSTRRRSWPRSRTARSPSDARRVRDRAAAAGAPLSGRMEQVLVLPHTASIAVPEVAARDVVEDIRRHAPASRSSTSSTARAAIEIPAGTPPFMQK